MFTRAFPDISKSDINIAGGKGASLGEMTRAGIPVPPGFVVLTGAFEKFLEETNMEVEIHVALNNVSVETIETVSGASEKIQTMMLSRKMPREVADEIKRAFDKLGVVIAAVRSSATAEDGEEGLEEVSSEKRESRKLSDEQIVELAKLVARIETHYGFPVDVEWALENGVFYITQSLPITTLSSCQ